MQYDLCFSQSFEALRKGKICDPSEGGVRIHIKF